MLLALDYLRRYPSPLRAYNMLQLRLMTCFIRRGGCAEAWCARYAAPFRCRFGWMLDDGAVPRPVARVRPSAGPGAVEATWT